MVRPKTLYKFCLRRVVNLARKSNKKVKKWEELLQDLPQNVQSDLRFEMINFPQYIDPWEDCKKIYLPLFLIFVIIIVWIYSTHISNQRSQLGLQGLNKTETNLTLSVLFETD